MISTLIRIRSWQWTLIGLVVGGLSALSVGMWGEPMLSAYGESINGKRQFEDALTKSEGGRHWFTDLTVHAERLASDGGGSRTVYVVSGSYYDGRSGVAGGAGDPTLAKWQRAFYVAEVPYHPATDLNRLQGGGDLATNYASLPQPTVVDFLNVMSRARGVQFTNAWWLSPANAQAIWLLIGIVGIGIAWPITLNLIVYGSIRRPPEEKGTDLRNVSTATATVAPPAPADTDQLDEVIDDLLDSTSTDESSPAPVEPSPAQPVAVRTLVTRPLEAVAASTAAEEKAFGAAAEDYYPTEIKATKKSKRDA